MHFLIVKTSSLGDILQAFPVCRYLRHHFPKATIDWVVETPFKELLVANSMVNGVIPIASKRWRNQLFSLKTWKEMGAFRRQLREKTYDVAIDLQGNVKSSLVLAMVKAKNKIGFGRKTVPEWPNLLFTDHRFNPPQGQNIREDYLFLAKAFFQKEAPPFSGIKLEITEEENQTLKSLVEARKNHYKILVCPGAAWANKQMHPQHLLKVLYQLQVENPYFFFLWGTEAEKRLAAQLASYFPSNGMLLERLTLPLLQNLMGKMDLVIAMDSLPLHLCGTTSTPTLSFFGPSSALKYRPPGDQHRTIQGSCPYGMTFEKRCPKLRTCETGACIKNIREC